MVVVRAILVHLPARSGRLIFFVLWGGKGNVCNNAEDDDGDDDVGDNPMMTITTTMIMEMVMTALAGSLGRVEQPRQSPASRAGNPGRVEKPKLPPAVLGASAARNSQGLHQFL